MVFLIELRYDRASSFLDTAPSTSDLCSEVSASLQKVWPLATNSCRVLLTSSSRVLSVWRLVRADSAIPQS